MGRGSADFSNHTRSWRDRPTLVIDFYGLCTFFTHGHKIDEKF